MNGCCCCVCISTGEVGVLERFGQFTRLAPAGLGCVCFPVERIISRISLRVQQLDVACETKTKDNVFVNVVVSVQYQVIREKLYDAFYRLTNADQQIRAYVYDVIRSTLPKLELDEAFQSKEDVAASVKASLQEFMTEYGYTILQALVTDLSPDQRVKDAMNQINASKRLREASAQKAEADKILVVKAAEADAESKYLSGLGVAKQRKAIVEGLQESINNFAGHVDGTSAKDVMDLLLLTQYFDMLKDVGGNAKTIFIPHTPGAVHDFQAQIRVGSMVDGIVPPSLAAPSTEATPPVSRSISLFNRS